MQHLYRKAAISAHCLKGSDVVLYNALLASRLFDVSLHPVILRETSYEEDVQEPERYAYRADGVEMDTATPRKKKKISREFHISKWSAIQKISSRDYVEHTGNSAMPAEYRYFGGGMFVRAK